MRLILIAVTLLNFIGCKNNFNYKSYTRSELRYYAYAPPFIPHEILNPECLDCHGRGLVVEGRKAPVTPHPELENCQQCHIRPQPGVKLFKANRFVGIKEPKHLPRPQPYGPPVIPHRIFMREKCLVCHGDPQRREIVQTTHPERTNCRQCHVPQDTQVQLFKSNTNLPDLVAALNSD